MKHILRFEINFHIFKKIKFEGLHWINFCNFLGLLLIAAVILALNPLRDAVLNESCVQTQCSAALNLKCINGICQCYSYEYYTDKCRSIKRSNKLFLAGNFFLFILNKRSFNSFRILFHRHRLLSNIWPYMPMGYM